MLVSLCRLALLAAATVLVTLLSATSAGAVRSIGLSPAGEEIVLGWDSEIRFGLPVNTTMFTCGGDLDVTLNATVPLTPGASVGTVTGATFYSCLHASGTPVEVTTSGLSWNIALRDFAGPVPRRGRSDDAPRTLDVAIEGFQVYDTLLECPRAGDLPLRVHFNGSPSVSGPVELTDVNLAGTGDCIGLDFPMWGYFRFSPQVTLVPAR